jgi:hypothetical protein
MWLRDAALTGRLPTLRQLTYDPQFFPYRWGQALWSYIGGRWGDAAVGQILKQVGQGVPYDESFERILNADLETIVEDWQTSIRRTYLPLLTNRREAREEARPLITQRGKGGRYNVGPGALAGRAPGRLPLRPGRAGRGALLANAETGAIVRRLVKGPAFDAHFSSLRFINSAGAWAPDNRRFVLSAQRRGTDVLVTLDTRNANIIREYRIPG